MLFGSGIFAVGLIIGKKYNNEEHWKNLYKLSDKNYNELSHEYDELNKDFQSLLWKGKFE
jgi:hypothetical protein